MSDLKIKDYKFFDYKNGNELKIKDLKEGLIVGMFPKKWGRVDFRNLRANKILVIKDNFMRIFSKGFVFEVK